jgi:hypothetical protein
LGWWELKNSQLGNDYVMRLRLKNGSLVAFDTNHLLYDFDDCFVNDEYLALML